MSAYRTAEMLQLTNKIEVETIVNALFELWNVQNTGRENPPLTGMLDAIKHGTVKIVWEYN